MERSPSKADSIDDPASFKGQMAARYKERQSMGFHVVRNGESTNTPVERDSSVTTDEADVDIPVEQTHYPKPMEDGQQGSDKIADNNSGTALNPRRSMKDLITQFEKRSSQSSPASPSLEKNLMPLQSASTDTPISRGLAREAWRGSNRALHMDLDTMADTSSSSSISIARDDAALTDRESRGLARTRQKRSNSGQRERKDKISRGLRSASSIHLEINNANLIVGAGTESTGSPVWAGDQFVNEGGMFGVKGAEETSQDITDLNKEPLTLVELERKTKQLHSGGDEIAQQTKATRVDENVDTDTWKTMQTEYKDKDADSLPRDVVELGTSESVDDAAVPQPLRINLKDFATRKKRSSNSLDMKYVVHRKDWKKYMQTHQGPGGHKQQKAGQTTGALPENTTQRQSLQPKKKGVDLRILNKLEPTQDSSTVDNSVASGTSSVTTKKAFTSASNIQQRTQHRNVNKTPPFSPINANAPKKMNAVSLLRPESALRKHGGAMERYLMFLNRTSKLGTNAGGTKVDKEKTPTADTASAIQRRPSMSFLDQRHGDLTKPDLEKGGGAFTSLATVGSSLPSSPSPHRRRDFPHQNVQALLKHAFESDGKTASKGVKYIDSSQSSGSFISNANTLSTLELDKHTERALARLGEVTVSKESNDTYAICDEPKLVFSGESSDFDASTLKTKPPDITPQLSFNFQSTLNTKNNLDKRELQTSSSILAESTLNQSDITPGAPKLYTSRRAQRSVQSHETNVHETRKSVSPHGRMTPGSNVAVDSRSRSSPATFKQNITPRTLTPQNLEHRISKRTAVNQAPSPDIHLYSGQRKHISDSAYLGKQQDRAKKAITKNTEDTSYLVEQSNLTVDPDQAELYDTKLLQDQEKGEFDSTSYQHTLGRILQRSSLMAEESSFLHPDHYYNTLQERIERHTNKVDNSDIPDSVTMRQLNTLDMIRMLRHDTNTHQITPGRAEPNRHTSSPITHETLEGTPNRVPPRHKGNRRPLPSGSGIGVQSRRRPELSNAKNVENGGKSLDSPVIRSRSTHITGYSRFGGTLSLLHPSRQKSPKTTNPSHVSLTISKQNGQREQHKRASDENTSVEGEQDGSIKANITSQTSKDSKHSFSPIQTYKNARRTPSPVKDAAMIESNEPASRPPSVKSGIKGSSNLSKRFARGGTNTRQEQSSRSFRNKTPDKTSSTTSVHTKDKLKKASTDPSQSQFRNNTKDTQSTESTKGVSLRARKGTSGSDDRTTSRTSRLESPDSERTSRILTGRASAARETGSSRLSKPNSQKEISNTHDDVTKYTSLESPPTKGKDNISRESTSVIPRPGSTAEEKKVNNANKAEDALDEKENKMTCHFGGTPADVSQPSQTGQAEEDKKEPSSADASPLKRKRKLVDRMKKMRKKKRKKRDGDSASDDKKETSPIPQKTTREKSILKERPKDKIEKGTTDSDNKYVTDAATMKPSFDCCAPSPEKKKLQKELSFANSVATPAAVKKDCSPVTGSPSHNTGVTSVTIRRRSRSRSPPRTSRSAIKLPPYHSVTRLSNRPTSALPLTSQIPLQVTKIELPSRKMRTDILAKYRRWREGMVDPDKPSKIPLSPSFRWTLDSAVVEEWALHCWEPDSGVYMDENGAWWSSVAEDPTDKNLPASLLADSKPFSVDGVLEFGSRLRNAKFGPLRMSHASYLMMGGTCLMIAHIFARLFNCNGDDYDFFCKDDDVECISQFSKIEADWME